MKVLYYDCFSGISGDMNLGAMIDLGIEKEYLISELKKLGLNEYEIKVSKDNRKGISGTRVDVILMNEQSPHHHHFHRNLKDILSIINSSMLNENVKKLSADIFMKVALAEAKVHDVPLNEVHFHEVGAVDSIVDIIGAAICIDYLKVDKIMSSKVEVGGGFVKCAHGILPVPAPATAEILKDIPIKSGRIFFEATTPTGAAILASIVNEYTDSKSFNIKKIGCGIGHKDEGDIPNILRVFLGETQEEKYLEKGYSIKDYNREEAIILECNIDDMNPEIYGYVMEKLLKNGAMDVYMTPIIMKKGRPAIILSVLCDESTEEKLQDILLIETTTIGVRKYRVKKTMLKRETVKINTIYGDVSAKISYINGETVKFKPEYEDCKKIAEDYIIPIKKVYDEVNRKGR